MLFLFFLSHIDIRACTLQSLRYKTKVTGSILLTSRHPNAAAYLKQDLPVLLSVLGCGISPASVYNVITVTAECCALAHVRVSGPVRVSAVLVCAAAASSASVPLTPITSAGRRAGAPVGVTGGAGLLDSLGCLLTRPTNILAHYFGCGKGGLDLAECSWTNIRRTHTSLTNFNRRGAASTASRIRCLHLFP